MQKVAKLIEKFQPIHYDLSIDIGRPDRKFSGTVTIQGVSTLGADSISLHSKDLVIETVVFDGKKADFHQGIDDELNITHPDLTEGGHVVVVAFSGKITDSMHGLYPCYYKHDGIEKELIATQFESHHAREVFPCIDEPEAKATFDLSLHSEKNVTALSNMPVKSQVIQNDKLITTFDTTPRMSTYLLAFVVGELHKKTATTKSGVEVNVWATLAQPLDSLDFALQIASRSIDFFDEYFETSYPLPKSDHVALPDFSSAAMENWGLITYREMALLADPKTASIYSKRYLAGVIAHELSHQWFGNLVTMKWWNDLWLNESFATLMASLAIDKLEPSWNEWLSFSSNECAYALRRDSIDGIQPVQIDVNHPDEISTLFDAAIVYAKGARLMRMVQFYIGDEAFQSGLQQYFSKFKYQNTVGNDLWAELSKASDKDITNLMNIWISQPGFPVVHMDRDSNNNITLRQEQFFVGPHEHSNKLWPIPLNSSCSEMPTILESRKVIIARKHTSLLRFNVGNSAHFITHYSDELLEDLLTEVEKGNLDPVDRLQLLFEQTMLARAGTISSAKLINILSFYKNETTEAVWDIISVTIGELKKFVEKDKAAENKLRQLATDVAHKQYERLGWDIKAGEPESDTKLRATVIGLTAYGEHQPTLDKAISLYKEKPIENLPPELRSVIISTCVRHVDDRSIIDKLLDLYGQTASSDLKEDIAAGITSTKDTDEIKILLETIKNSKLIRPQDVARWFAYLLRNREGREISWEWLKTNWSWIQRTFAGDKSYDNYPRFAGSALVTRQQLEDYRRFFTPMMTEPALKRAIAVGLIELEGRVELVERDGDAVVKALLDF